MAIYMINQGNLALPGASNIAAMLTLVRLQEKMDEDMANGVRLGVLIDRKKQHVHVYRPNQSPRIIACPTEVHCSPELPGFELKMDKSW